MGAWDHAFLPTSECPAVVAERSEVWVSNSHSDFGMGICTSVCLRGSLGGGLGLRCVRQKTYIPVCVYLVHNTWGSDYYSSIFSHAYYIMVCFVCVRNYLC